LLRVSEVTIRRDLEDLERRGLLERTHGGAVLAQCMACEPLSVEAASRHPFEKQRIGAAAARLAADGTPSSSTEARRRSRLPGT
jgi:DeoR/GlpR family transcriptional regulator of sugar metabolism